jgi:indole-3-glycerol phosphate synthase
MKKDFLETILKEKAIEVEKMELEVPGTVRKTYSFVEYVKNHPEKMHVIGEVKRASPSLGDINTNVDVLGQATAYETAGVAAISVLTDPVFFKGTIDDLRLVASNVKIPVLNKDFIIDEKQLNRAVNSGATIVLLIVAALSSELLTELYTKAKALGLEVLVEVHNEEELRIAESIGAELIGVNNRNLKTFVVSLDTSVALGELQKTDALYISESGVKTPQDVKKVSKNYGAVLVGETLMKASDPAEAVKSLQVSR